MFWLTRVRSHSMAPTLSDGQLVLTRWLRRTSPVRRGDLVVVDSAEVGGRVVKRVIGLPGETVSITGGRVAIDGSPLAEPYAVRSTFRGEFHVPMGHFFLLGDNRDQSSDSRTWQQPYLPRTALRGRLLRGREGRRAAAADRRARSCGARGAAVGAASRSLRVLWG